MVRILLLLVALSIAGCSGQNGMPLPVVNADDPTFQLQLDHLNYGQLPI